MLSKYLPTPDLQDAPLIVRRLRQAFDEKLERLYDIAIQMDSDEPDQATKMVHVPFDREGYAVEAMYDVEQDLFTQLVARPKSAQDNDRPAYTISLFLVGHDAGTEPRT